VLSSCLFIVCLEPRAQGQQEPHSLAPLKSSPCPAAVPVCPAAVVQFCLPESLSPSHPTPPRFGSACLQEAKRYHPNLLRSLDFSRRKRRQFLSPGAASCLFVACPTACLPLSLSPRLISLSSAGTVPACYCETVRELLCPHASQHPLKPPDIRNPGLYVSPPYSHLSWAEQLPAALKVEVGGRASLKERIVQRCSASGCPLPTSANQLCYELGSTGIQVCSQL
jgi:hypothetical protein